MKSVCFFASYFKSNSIPYYLRVYLTELKKQFDTVVLISTQPSLSDESLGFLDQNGIDSMNESNEGFDFGLWYKTFCVYDVSGIDKIALVNDSCVLFKSLDAFMTWSKIDKADLQGITYSDAVSKHIQSYFLIINKNAIEFVKNYFNQHKILTDIKEVISVYEIGLSREMIAKGYTISAFMDNQGYKGEFSPYYHCINYHIENGVPLIKKKIMDSSYRKDELFTLARMNFNISREYYIERIKKYNKSLIIDFDKLLAVSPSKLGQFGKIKYNLYRFLVQLFRPLYKLVKK